MCSQAKQYLQNKSAIEANIDASQKCRNMKRRITMDRDKEEPNRWLQKEITSTKSIADISVVG